MLVLTLLPKEKGGEEMRKLTMERKDEKNCI
jgi:hypothetical protein